MRLEATCGQKGGIWRRKILTAFEKMGAELGLHFSSSSGRLDAFCIPSVSLSTQPVRSSCLSCSIRTLSNHRIVEFGTGFGWFELGLEVLGVTLGSIAFASFYLLISRPGVSLSDHTCCL